MIERGFSFFPQIKILFCFLPKWAIATKQENEPRGRIILEYSVSRRKKKKKKRMKKERRGEKRMKKKRGDKKRREEMWGQSPPLIS